MSNITGKYHLIKKSVIEYEMSNKSGPNTPIIVSNELIIPCTTVVDILSITSYICGISK